jgi:hypothetical protein
VTTSLEGWFSEPMSSPARQWWGNVITSCARTEDDGEDGQRRACGARGQRPDRQLSAVAPVGEAKQLAEADGLRGRLRRGGRSLGLLVAGRCGIGGGIGGEIGARSGRLASDRSAWELVVWFRLPGCGCNASRDSSQGGRYPNM